GMLGDALGKGRWPAGDRQWIPRRKAPDADADVPRRRRHSPCYSPEATNGQGRHDMPMALQGEDGGICRVEIRGTLRKSDFARSQDDLAAEIRRQGRVRLLILLSAFEGWAPDAGWNDLSFYIKH